MQIKTAIQKYTYLEHKGTQCEGLGCALVLMFSFDTFHMKFEF